MYRMSVTLSSIIYRFGYIPSKECSKLHTSASGSSNPHPGGGQSLSAFERFQDEQGEAYRSLDAELMPLTADELFIGAFDE